MTLDISHDVYVVAAKYAESDAPAGWNPIQTQCYLDQDIAEMQAAQMASKGFRGDQYAVIEFSATEPRIVGERHHGVRHDPAAVEESSGPAM